MNVRINAVRFDSDAKLDDFIQKKVGKLERYFDDIIEAEVYLKVGNTQDMENKIVEIRLFVPGSDLFVMKHCKTFEEATDNAVDALKQQILKRKEKIRGL